MKKLVIALVVLLVLVVVVVEVVLLSIGSVTKGAIEKGGTWALGAETTLGSASLKPIAGQLSIGELHIANPDGFDRPHFMTMGTGDVEVRTASLFEETVEVSSIRINSVDVQLERTAAGANYQVILDHLEKLGSSDKPTSEEPGKSKGYLIHEILIENVNVNLDAPVIGKAANMDIPIEQIRLENIGSEGDNGAAMSEVTRIVMQAIMQAIVQAGAGVLPAEILDGLGQGLAGLPDLSQLGVDVLADTGAGLQDVANETADQLRKSLDDETKKAVDDLGKGLGDLLKGNKK